MRIQPYLQFDGRCEKGVRLYKAAVGAEVQMMTRHRESPTPPPPGRLPAGSEDKIMHVAFRIGDAVVMATDGMCGGKPAFNGSSLAVSVATEADAKDALARLAEGGSVQMPLTKRFWSAAFDMLLDCFGVSWRVMVAA